MTKQEPFTVSHTDQPQKNEPLSAYISFYIICMSQNSNMNSGLGKKTPRNPNDEKEILKMKKEAEKRGLVLLCTGLAGNTIFYRYFHVINNECPKVSSHAFLLEILIHFYECSLGISEPVMHGVLRMKIE